MATAAAPSSVKIAATVLAARAVAVRHGSVKTAFLGNALGQAGNAVKGWWNNQSAGSRNLMKGTAIGAGLGGLGGFAFGTLDENENPRPFNSALTGALAGGAIGAGIAGVRNAAGSMQQKTDTQAKIEEREALQAKTKPTPAGQALNQAGDVAKSTLSHPLVAGTLGANAAYEGFDQLRRIRNPLGKVDAEAFRNGLRDNTGKFPSLDKRMVNAVTRMDDASLTEHLLKRIKNPRPLGGLTPTMIRDATQLGLGDGTARAAFDPMAPWRSLKGMVGAGPVTKMTTKQPMLRGRAGTAVRLAGPALAMLLAQRNNGTATPAELERLTQLNTELGQVPQ